MQRYVLGRLLLMVPTLLGVAILTFVIMRMVPGDIVELRYASGGAGVSQELIDQERALLGLDKPMYAQFADWMGGIVRLDFGTSLWTGRSVIDEIAVRLELSIELAVLATLLAIARNGHTYVNPPEGFTVEAGDDAVVVAESLGALSPLQMDNALD